MLLSKDRTMTERQTQELLAHAHTGGVYRHHFVVGARATFSAVAPSREAALMVLDAEQPGARAGARYDGATTVFCFRERTREAARLQLAGRL